MARQLAGRELRRVSDPPGDFSRQRFCIQRIIRSPTIQQGKQGYIVSRLASLPRHLERDDAAQGESDKLIRSARLDSANLPYKTCSDILDACRHLTVVAGRRLLKTVDRLFRGE